jgi:hypothetical protein
MGWLDILKGKAHLAAQGVRTGATRAYEGAKVAHGKYNAYQEKAYERKLTQVQKQKRLVQAEAAVAKAQMQKRTYGTSPRMESHSLQNQGYRRAVGGEQEGRIRNDMDRQGGYRGGYKQYGGEAPLFARPQYKKEWWE